MRTVPPRHSRVRCSNVLAAALCLACALSAGTALAQTFSLAARLEELRELGRFVPDKALDTLLQMEPKARAAPLPEKAEFLSQVCQARLKIGQHQQALAVCDELIALARQLNNDVALAKGLLSKSYVVYAMGEQTASHQLAWESEKIAAGTKDAGLKLRAAITAGEAYAEEGNFPMALTRLDAAANQARQDGQPVNMVMALNALARLYGRMREYDKGFSTLAEAMPFAEMSDSPGRVATLRSAEYGLAIDSGQPARAVAALLEALKLERKIGASAMVAYTLSDLSDSYLKAHDYPRALRYAGQVVTEARAIGDFRLEATARVNVGQAYLGMGKLAEGKRSFEAGLAVFEKSGNKPDLQGVLVEYGAALERVGDLQGSVEAYHRERALSNEMFERRRQKAMMELQAQYEGDRKERQIELLRRENQVKSTELENRNLQQRIWWLLAAVFGMGAAIVGTLYTKIRHANFQLHLKNLELKQQSVRDPLTALYNRRHFQDFMRGFASSEKRGAGASGEEMVGALFLLDVDHFKQINDAHGHAAGDAVLKMIALALQDILRETDMIVRWGGEEFLAFLPAVPRSSLEEVARRVLTGIASLSVEYQGEPLSAHVSIGFSPFPLAPGGVALPWERAVNLVDMALYMAKSHGRNRAYGVNGFANFDQTTMEEIEENLEQAWRAGYVDLSVVLGGWPELRAAS
ncbi:tetratricopeptide repeat-containing diguanylate cyclase [Massilia sp. S19_KUP03_FR1]|uniref:tetratricopeptide repeat-containing diguanylate cyclase n=1 Tax=Massilia sp. S19_KUP03_FR1 TaxID=3025503 RepID=UPI002FCD8655